MTIRRPGDTNPSLMPYDPAEVIPYKRSRFQTRLPKARLYTPSHCWLSEIEPGLWRVGFTRFATRMLGEVVEQGFELKSGDAVAVGQTIGWVEGFKALSDLYCVVDGIFVGGNPALDAEPALVDKDPYHQGWLYEARGAPDVNAVRPEGYILVLDAVIEKMQETT